jgi:hypothetical protein
MDQITCCVQLLDKNLWFSYLFFSFSRSKSGLVAALSGELYPALKSRLKMKAEEPVDLMEACRLASWICIN